MTIHFYVDNNLNKTVFKKTQLFRGNFWKDRHLHESINSIMQTSTVIENKFLEKKIHN